MEVITVPTEVVLWRMVPAATKTTCLDIYAGAFRRACRAL